MTPGENTLCGSSPGSSQARGAPQSDFARGGLAAAQPRLTFLAPLGAVEANVSSHPHPHTRFFDPWKGFCVQVASP